ncbi:MAG: hypothetical protein H7246_01005 [Phycisphaerae bacterium]|nr:hypothetical protein [Saprospiraceae bacterium]
MRIPWTILLFLALFSACKTSKKVATPVSNYPNNVGDIHPDPLLDDPAFRACRESNIPQYYSVQSGFEGEKPAIERYFKQNFKKSKAFEQENGYLTIRFVVNCNGQTGRFRILEMDLDYQPKKFPEALSGQILQLTKQMTGWLPGKSETIPYDYYQYLTFTIVQGEIAQITP